MADENLKLWFAAVPGLAALGWQAWTRWQDSQGDAEERLSVTAKAFPQGAVVKASFKPKGLAGQYVVKMRLIGPRTARITGISVFQEDGKTTIDELGEPSVVAIAHMEQVHQDGSPVFVGGVVVSGVEPGALIRLRLSIHAAGSSSPLISVSRSVRPLF